MSLISIIVPVYNADPYLPFCINSLMNQSLEDIEIILVDDGSTDRSSSICEDFAKKDKRIKVIHKKNSGAADSRNMGIDIAQSEYVMFVDADDYVESQYCEIPYKLAKEHDADLVIFQYREVELDDNNNLIKTSPKQFIHQDGIKTNDEAMWMMTHESLVGPWSKLYKISLVKQNKFSPGRAFEDNSFTHYIIHDAKTIYYTQTILYNYRYVKKSISHTRSPEHDIDVYELIRDKANVMIRWGYSEDGLTLKAQNSLFYLIHFGRHSIYSNECINECTTTKYADLAYMNSYKYLWKLFRISPHLFDLVCILTNNRH